MCPTKGILLCNCQRAVNCFIKGFLCSNLYSHFLQSSSLQIIIAAGRGFICPGIDKEVHKKKYNWEEEETFNGLFYV